MNFPFYFFYSYSFAMDRCTSRGRLEIQRKLRIFICFRKERNFLRIGEDCKLEENEERITEKDA